MSLRLYIIGGIVALLLTSGVLWHFYAKGKEAALKQQVIATQKVIVKNRKSDAKIDHKTPSADKSAALEWLRKSVRE